MSVSAPVKLTIKDYKSELHNDWCPGCLAPETEIVLANGATRAIRDIVVVDADTDVGTFALLKVESTQVVPYDGYVHNLEVEDAHSYVTPQGALHNCGDFGILTGIQMALAQLQLDPDKVAMFSGIGCSGKTPHYINAYGFHTLHGRVLPVATGGRLANTALTVIALGGA